MYRHRSLFPILRCPNNQSRSAATAAQLKTSNQEYNRSESIKKWSPLQSLDRPPSAKSWARQSEHRPRTSERQSQTSHPPSRPEIPNAKWSPSSLDSRLNSNKNWDQNRRPPKSGWKDPKPFSNKASPLKTQNKPTVAKEVENPMSEKDSTKTQSHESEFGAEFDTVEEDERHLKSHSRANRLRSDQYKIRGSIVQKLEQGKLISKQKDSQKDPVRKPKAHLPRLKDKPRMDVYIPSTVTVGTLARVLDIRFDRLIRKMAEAGMAEEATHDHLLTPEYAVLLAEELGYNPIINDEAAFDLYPPPAAHPEPSSLPSRPPIVTIMGHVDHGKTTLLDTLRCSAVAKGEAGGITQHIGAFSVPVKSSQGQQSITFLDTPGHAAFSAMRARGAGVTDIVVLVVAADDGIMPQTKEVIGLLRKDAGHVGLVVAINKVDKPEADIEAVKLSLMSEGIQLETFGGDVPSVEVSGLTGKGLPDLIETLSAVAELQELRAEKEGPIHGYILESKITKGLGPVATVLVLRGCLKLGSYLLSGTHPAKVRVMTDPSGKNVKAAYAGMAVTVSGWKTLPKAGDEVLDGAESDVKRALANRVRQVEIASSLADVDSINAARREERERRKAEFLSDGKDPSALTEPSGPKELKLVIKADVSGSAEAVEGALQGIGNKEAVTKIISSSVGNVTESDVLMAKAVNATIVAFSVSVPRSVEILAAQNAVPIAKSPIIYRLMEDIQQRVITLLPTIKETKVVGEATVLQLFDIHLKAKQVKKVAGCRVVNGIVEKGRSARIVRDGSVIYEGALDTLRILKKEVTEVRKGSECGLGFLDFADLHEGDLIQMYQTIEKPGVL